MMRFSPIPPLLSQLRLARRAAASASSRFSSTVSAPYPNLSDCEQQVNNNFDFSLSNINQTGLLRVLNSAKDDPNLALSFLRQLKQNGVPLNLNAYAALVRILSRWRLDRKLDSVLVEVITNEEERGFCVMELMEAIGEEEGADSSNFLLARVSGALVKAYVGLGMFDEAIDVLYQSRRLGCVPGIKSCNFLMNRLVEFGRTDMVVALFRQLNQLGLPANDYTYAIVVKALCRKRDLDGAARLLEETSSVFAYTTFIEGLCLNGKTEMAFALIDDLVDAKALSGDALGFAFGMLVRGFCKEMNAEAAEQVIFKMEEFGIGPDVYACSEIIDLYCKSLELDKALRIVDAMLQKGLRINCVIVSSILHCYCKMGALRESAMWLGALKRFQEFKEMDVFLDEVCYNAAFEALSKLERVEEAMKLLEEMMDKGMVPDVVNYTTLIDGYCLQGRFADALDLFDEMRAKGTDPDVITYNVIAGALARNGHSEKAVEIYIAMRNEGVEPTAVTHSVIIDGLCSAGKLEEAREFFTSLEDKCPENYASLVKGYCDSGLAKDAYRKFVELNSPLPKNLCFKLFTALCDEDNKNCQGKALRVLKRMWAYGVEPARSMYGKMISKVDSVREAELVFDKMVGRGNLPDLVTYTIMIQTYSRLMELQKASDLFEAMKQRGIKPDLIIYTVLFHGYLRLDREMGCVLRGEAKQIWKKLGAACIEPDVKMYTVLMNHHCKIGNVDIATDILYRMIECGLKPDNVTYNVLISACHRKGCTDALVTELSGKDITLPEHLFAVVKRAMKTRRSQYRK
ncbi:PREDICTED: pentatricopeptide repeat-containing protein At2g26790, mitochondrial [Brassica oleracea var. oleracea]|uniref:Pentacotripeptide-repeat region of PRORP domain-containing protein n=2 Tax=Brassica TaxID=3705 RepID=A0A0D3BUJ7_BRAOL|nr:PREDICTED: pentatricopeptide repeat-containing protein At2g26790, mitochondrial [Brassica oleracea var. oleracea]